MDLGIRGKRAAVAAGSAGLGLGTARALVEAGCSVAICGRDQARLDAAVAELGGDTVGLVADVATSAGAVAWVQAAAEALGGIDILVANGGGPPIGNYASTPFEEYEPALERSLLATVAMVYETLPAMQAQQWGRILAITSVSVRQPLPNIILSNTARAGLTGFLKTVSREIAASGVTVNSIQPGSHLTARLASQGEDQLAAAAKAVPTGVLGDPDDFGQVAAFLCSESAKFITGAALHVDGGAYAALQ